MESVLENIWTIVAHALFLCCPVHGELSKK